MATATADPLAPCGYCRRCAIHDDPGGCLTVEAYVRENATWLGYDEGYVVDWYMTAGEANLALQQRRVQAIAPVRQGRSV